MPKLVIISWNGTTWFNNAQDSMIWVGSVDQNDTIRYCTVNGKTLSWYNNKSAHFQLNGTGDTYYWIAIG